MDLGQVDTLALPYESYQGTFELFDASAQHNLLKTIYGEGNPGVPLVDEQELRRTGYCAEDGYWWIPSGQQAFDPARFYLPTIARDPFGADTTTSYDRYVLLPETVTDALDNHTLAANDYRVLQPKQVTDPNGNIALAAFDALGLVVGTAVRGKNGEGDTLDSFRPDLSPEQIAAYRADPRGAGPGLLGSATTRIVYDLWAYRRSAEQGREPVFAAALAREQHGGKTTQDKIQHRIVYSDGFGREVQTKIQAEPGPIEPNDPMVDPRWVASGTTVYNNKGKPVRQYEPFFSATHHFGPERHGVSPTLFYDPLQRVVCTLRPMASRDPAFRHSYVYDKVVFDPWHQETWDVNDTLLVKTDAGQPVADPLLDPHVGHFFRDLPNGEGGPTWYEQRASDSDPAEQRAAREAAKHAGTPTVAHLDTLGRPFLTIADNGEHGAYKTRIQLDIEGNDLAITDQHEILAFRHTFDLAGRKLRIDSRDAGLKRMLLDVAGKPVLAWDANGNRARSEYDALQRPVSRWIAPPSGAEFLAQRTLYGEAHPRAEALNLRGRVYQVYGGAGLVTNTARDKTGAEVAYDFKGNLRASSRRLVRAYDRQPDWKPLEPLLSTRTLTSPRSRLPCSPCSLGRPSPPSPHTTRSTGW